jgi:GT2 family glycosyltransferase
MAPLSPATLDMARRTRAIIVHYGDPRLTAGALASIERGTARPGAVVIVDNGPPEEGLSPAECAVRVYLVKPGRNTGFAGGVQLGLQEPTPEECSFVWLLNNDAEADPGALAELLEAKGRLPERVLVSSLIMELELPDIWFENAVYLPWRLEGRHIRSERSNLDGDVLLTRASSWRAVPYLPGCSLIAPKAMFDQVGGLDETFFVYGEDVDLSLRARRAGYELAIARRSVVRHRSSSGSNLATRERLIAETSFRLTARYYPWLLLPAVAGGLLTGLKRGAGRRQLWWLTSRLAGYRDALRHSPSRPALPR